MMHLLPVLPIVVLIVLSLTGGVKTGGLAGWRVSTVAFFLLGGG